MFTVVKLAGALYLVYLGVQTFRHRRDARRRARRAGRRRSSCGGSSSTRSSSASPTRRSSCSSSPCCRSSSTRPPGRSPLQLLTLGAVFCAIALVCDGIWALAAGAARSWLVRSPRRLEAIGGTGGIVMIGLGAGLAVERPQGLSYSSEPWIASTTVEVDRAPAVDELVDLEQVEILAQRGARGGRRRVPAGPRRARPRPTRPRRPRGGRCASGPAAPACGWPACG